MTEYQRVASQIRDIAIRIGVAASPAWIRERLDQLANQYDHWGSIGADVEADRKDERASEIVSLRSGLRAWLRDKRACAAVAEDCTNRHGCKCLYCATVDLLG